MGSCHDFLRVMPCLAGLLPLPGCCRIRTVARIRVSVGTYSRFTSPAGMRLRINYSLTIVIEALESTHDVDFSYRGHNCNPVTGSLPKFLAVRVAAQVVGWQLAPRCHKRCWTAISATLTTSLLRSEATETEYELILAMFRTDLGLEAIKGGSPEFTGKHSAISCLVSNCTLPGLPVQHT